MTMMEEAGASFGSHFRARRFLPLSQNKIYCVGWDRLGSRLATGANDHTACVWRVKETGEAIREGILKGHKASVDQLCWDPSNANTVATIAGDRSARLWDVRSQTCVAEVAGSSRNLSLAWQPGGQTIAVGDASDVVSFIDVRTFKVASKLARKGREVNEVSWDGSGSLFFLATGAGVLEVLSYDTMETVNRLKAHTGGIVALASDPTGKHFATGGTDAIISLWDSKDMTCMSSFSKFDSPVRTLGFSHCGRFMAYASEEKLVSFVDVAGNACRLVHQETTVTAIQQLAWNPARNIVAYVGDSEKEMMKEVITIASYASD